MLPIWISHTPKIYIHERRNVWTLCYLFALVILPRSTSMRGGISEKLQYLQALEGYTFIGRATYNKFPFTFWIHGLYICRWPSKDLVWKHETHVEGGVRGDHWHTHEGLRPNSAKLIHYRNFRIWHIYSVTFLARRTRGRGYRKLSQDPRWLPQHSSFVPYARNMKKNSLCMTMHVREYPEPGVVTVIANEELATLSEALLHYLYKHAVTR